MDDVRFAIVGTGSIAKVHAEAIGAIDHASLAAVYDAVPERARAFAAEHGCRACADLDDLLASADVQVVTIATPTGAHAATAIPACQAGKHVLCEKPLDTTVEKARAIVAAAERHEVILSAVFQMRFSDNVQAIRQALAAGRFGHLVLAGIQVKWLRTQAYYDSAAWRGTWELDGGGCLMNQSIHFIDLLTYLVGRPVQVFGYCATANHQGIEVEDQAVASLRFANGCFGSIQATTSAAPGFPPRLELAGTGGSVVIEGDELRCWQFVDECPEDEQVRSHGAAAALKTGATAPMDLNSEGHRRQFADLVDALRSGREPMIPGRDGLDAVELIGAIYESSRRAAPVDLYPRD